jgi:hypothetical protein
MPGRKREARLFANVPGIHVLLRKRMAGTSPAMMENERTVYV